MSHPLPSARHLADFQAFFTSARLLPNGKVQVLLTLPKEMREATLHLANNDGMLLNVSVWETGLGDGEDELARALGIGMAAGPLEVDESPTPKMVAKK